MKTLVTGSTGCVGSAFVERLLARGYEVRALARKTSYFSHLKTTGAEIVFGDITDFQTKTCYCLVRRPPHASDPTRSRLKT